jgi:Domain of unknown function (DUF4126)
MDASVVVSAVLTGLGLAGAAGLNAYIPLLVVGVLARLDVVSLDAPYDVLASTPVLVAVGVLLLVEVLADKVPAVDSLNDVIGTVVRPLAGALLFAGSLGVLTDLPPWVGAVAGLLTAGGVHATKATARPALNVASGGAAAPVVSTVEDVVSAVASVLAVLAPVALVVFVLAVAWWVHRRLARVRARRAGRPAADPVP